MADRIPLGLKLPLSRFALNYDTRSQLKSNLINLIMTKKGERIFQPTFGCDIRNVLFDNNTEQIKDSLETSIRQSISRWMPYLIVNNMIIQLDIDTYKAIITVQYSIQNGTITDIISVRI